MYNGKQGEQLEGKVVTVLAWTEHVKCRGLSEQGGHKVMQQHETHNWNNLDKFEPQQQYHLGTVSYK